MTLKETSIYFLLILLISGCDEKFTPKPRGYFRIDFPQKEYRMIDEEMPYKFEIPTYSELVPDTDKLAEPFWVNVEIHENKAEIHISYKKLDQDTNKQILAKYMEESRKLVYKHTIKADAIEERIFMNPISKVYGTIYMIEGNAASPIQFYLTDSTKHFLRGALYIREVPNMDSIQPVIKFLEPDVIRLIESTTWN